jgi:CBS domain-containing protein
MTLEQLMTRDLSACSPNDTLDCAARIMWERDCGVVPIVVSGRAVGVITDRDICMAAYTQGKRLSDIPVSTVAMKSVVSARRQDSPETAEQLMRKYQVRRLLVTDEDGRLLGLVSLGDLARVSSRRPGDPAGKDIGKTLGAISEPRQASASAMGS